MTKIVGLTYDLKSDRPLKNDDPIDANAELDTIETVDYIAGALQSAGHTVKKIGHAKNLISQIEHLDVDIVFNICEGHFGRNRESQVPLILEMYGVPFVGADALCLGITLDKVMAKKCFIADGVPTPPFFVAENSKDLKQAKKIGFPLIVKTRYEGTSKGLTEQSRVMDMANLTRQIDIINKKYKQSSLVEKFIKGTEFTVPVIGNENPEPMPVVQITMRGRTNMGNEFFTYDCVVDTEIIEYVCPAKISKKLSVKLQDLAVKAYKSVDCRDMGRVDFRVDEKGNPFVLEINPLPSLAKKDVFNQFPYVMGSTYQAMINRILNCALQRYGIKGNAVPLKKRDQTVLQTTVL